MQIADAPFVQTPQAPVLPGQRMNCSFAIVSGAEPCALPWNDRRAPTCKRAAG